MIGSIGKTNIYVRNKANHEVVFIDHGADGLRPRNHIPWGAKEGNWFPALGGFFLAALVVGTGPGMVRRNKRRVLRMNAERPGSGQHGMVPHSSKDLVGLGPIVIDALTISPA